MKRTLLYLAISLLAVLLPVERADVADLLPVETVQLYRQDDTIIIYTDTQNVGEGADVLEALANMKDAAPGIIYLDTAQYLLISESAEDQVELLRDHLKSEVTLYQCERPLDTKAVSQYLHIHAEGPALKIWKPGTQLQELEEKDGRIILLKKSQKSA